MSICGAKVHVLNGDLCIETAALTWFGLKPITTDPIDADASGDTYRQQLRSLGYARDMFITSDGKYIHLEAFFMIVVTMAAYTAEGDVLIELGSFLKTLFKLFVSFHTGLDNIRQSLPVSKTLEQNQQENASDLKQDILENDYNSSKNSHIEQILTKRENESALESDETFSSEGCTDRESDPDYKDPLPGRKMKQSGSDQPDLIPQFQKTEVKAESSTELVENATSDTVNNDRNAISGKSVKKHVAHTKKKTVKRQVKNSLGFECKQCGENFSSRVALFTHKKELHVECGKHASCSLCNKVFPGQKNLKRHMGVVHSQDRPHECLECGKKFKMKSQLARHMEIHSGQRDHVCVKCGKSFRRKSHLEDHITIHTNEKPHKCNLCDKSFTTKSSLVRHTNYHKGEKPHQCSFCGKLFFDKSNLKTHMMIHTGEKPFVCPECGKNHTTKGNLKSHLLVHTGYVSQDHPCPMCGKQFRSKAHLDDHISVHTGAKPNKCTVCGKCFGAKSALIKHMKIHSGDKPHQCLECGKQFYDKGALKNHTRIHTGEKPYMCSECGKTFRMSSSLKVHLNTHLEGEDAKPYQCPECGKQFRNKMYMKYHLMNHRGEKPHQCALCGKRFVIKKYLNYHMKTHARQMLPVETYTHYLTGTGQEQVYPVSYQDM